jgi:hypothetical protein
LHCIKFLIILKCIRIIWRDVKNLEVQIVIKTSSNKVYYSEFIRDMY